VFEFDDLCSIIGYLIVSTSKSVSESISSPTSHELKPLPDSLKYSFLRPDKSLPVINSFTSAGTQRKNYCLT